MTKKLSSSSNQSSSFGKDTISSKLMMIDPVKVKEVMDLIIAQNIFAGNTGTFVSAKEARLVEHNVTEYEIV